MSDASHEIVPYEILDPVFDGDPVVLVLAANDFYVPYLSALLESIADCASDVDEYDIIVFHSDISSEHRALLTGQMGKDNLSLRFLNTACLIDDYEGRLFLHGHFRIETYYRLFMQDLLPAYSKALYLDSDMIVLEDIGHLYHTDIDGYLIAAAHDADTAGLYNGYVPHKKDYIDNILGLKSPYDYFQAGTILFNLEEFRRTYSVEELFEYATSYKWELLDQDVLNHFGEGRTKFIDMKWNVMTDWDDIRVKEIISLAPDWLQEDYFEARSHPSIVHYAGPEKPWVSPNCDMAAYFWEFSRKTPFYREILHRYYCTQMGGESQIDPGAERRWLRGKQLFPYGSARYRRLHRLLHGDAKH